MSQVSLLGIGVSGLKASQAALATAGHNVTNANTEGYSRQRVELSSREGAFAGSGYQGSGVQVDDVTRVTDRYLANQIRTDTANAQGAKSYLDNAGAIDSLLANEQTGLGPGLDKLFASLQEASSDPTSIPARRLVLSEAGSLAARMHTLYDRLTQQNDTVNGELNVAAEQITTYAKGIAQLNLAIQRASGTGDNKAPSDMLDARDELLRKLAAEVDVNVVTQQDGLSNVFIGNGQVLVVGGETRTLVSDPVSGALSLNNSAGSQDVTGFLTGGRVGGLLRFRSEVLSPTLNGLGRTAQVLAQSVNEVHVQGVDLRGNFGGLLFSDINSVAAASDRVLRLQGNENTDLRLLIEDARLAGASDYQVSFNGPGDSAFEVKRLSDGEIVAHGNVDAATTDDGVVSVSFDSLRIEIHGGDFKAGDQFRLRPTRFGARDIGVALNEPATLALASPLRTTADVGNAGTGKLESATVLDVTAPAFAQPGKLLPPLLIKFTSATAYDVLDATDSSAPRPLSPPLRNLPFVPGSANALLPGANGERLALSDGGRAARLPELVTQITTQGLAAAQPGNAQPGNAQPGNGYLAETLRFTQPGPNGPLTSTIRTAAGDSARSVATALNGVRGVQARADSEVTITSLSRSADAPDLAVAVNGELFSGASVLSLATLADAINASGPLKQRGITAQSDGTRLVLRSSVGDDLRIAVRGDVGDSVVLEDRHGTSLAVRGAGAGNGAALTGTVNRAAGYDFRAGGPYSFSLAVDGGAAATITLDNDYNDGIELNAGLQSKIDAALGAGRVQVSLGSNGNLSLRSLTTGSDASITLGGAASGTNIARALGISDGSARGFDRFNAASVGGDVRLLVDKTVSFDATPTRPGGSLFRDTPTLLNPFLGYQVKLSGRPSAGDVFQVGFNGKGSSDNRNALALAELQNKALVGGGVATLADSYGEVVQIVGARTSTARLDSSAADGLLEQSTQLRQSYSGVNLDEEAADILRFEQAYTASTRVIATARTLFDSLLSIFN